jgi:hypothetical protein
MMYELSSPRDGESATKDPRSTEGQREIPRHGLRRGDGNLAKMVIALRTPDYGELIPQMLKNLDDANRANPHYLGWARHSYNDYLDAAN